METSINDEWENFCEFDSIDNDSNNTSSINDTNDKNNDNESLLEITDININRNDNDKNITNPSDLYISTTTIISYLNIPIDIYDVFWKIPIIPYGTPRAGVIKKQMKFISTSQEEVEQTLSNTDNYEFVDNHLISKVNKPNGRVKFKEVRKISIGICRKDIISYRCKKKGAFMNCFVVILRLPIKGIYKEIHIKVFNTGKLEIPGIQSSSILDDALKLLITILKPIVKTETPIVYLKNKSEIVLINSNFNCGYYVNREKLYEKLKYKYKINCVYDPCSYPGIQCEFYYNSNETVQTGINPDAIYDKHDKIIHKISFMIFRTGSVLIVGKCSEIILHELYKIICDILVNERNYVKGITEETFVKNKKPTKTIRKKIIC